MFRKIVKINIEQIKSLEFFVESNGNRWARLVIEYVIGSLQVTILF